MGGFNRLPKRDAAMLRDNYLACKHIWAGLNI
ncbi:hypothetical protein Gohar_008108 [Gossypium harknessii]|uniref:Uncharacterized protein n=1 Tax=Gossypium harknessii TaxID=34285 RepID=A0A7J9GIL2_9ROSI|nr:hypothetical protein [Gossypium harknessii]